MGGGQHNAGKTEVQTIRYKISSYTRVYCITWGRQLIFYNYKWSITLKNCESLYYIPVTHKILYSNYTAI